MIVSSWLGSAAVFRTFVREVGVLLWFVLCFFIPFFAFIPPITSSLSIYWRSLRRLANEARHFK